MNRIYDKRKFFLSITILIILSIILIGVLWELDKLSLDVPISYYGGDDYGTLKNAKTIKDTGWILENDYLGAPFGATYYEYPVTATLNFDNFILKIFLFFTDEIALAVNLQFITLFPLISVISYCVMTSLKINNIISIGSSLTYAFLPYIFLRGMSHTVLSAYQFIPLSILLCIWLYDDENFFVFNSKFFKYKKNIISLFFLFLIANNGIAYYPFFTCFFFIIVGFVKTINNKQVKYFLRSLNLAMCLVIFFIITLMPIILYNMNNSSVASTYRSRVDAEIYGLKLFQLFLPVRSHGISSIEKLINYYNTRAPLVNENSYSYLGISGAIGFIILICALFIKDDSNKKMDKIIFLSKLNIAAVLLGTIGGFGSMFAILITPMIRAYNRISIFIAYISLLALAIILDELLEKLSKKIICYVFIILLFTISIFEQFPGNVPNYDYVKNTYLSDKKFVELVESSVPEGSMIYQLPYHAYPESGPVNGMNDYHLLSPYFHSNTLKWSYGASKGSQSDLWNKTVSLLETEQLIKTISIIGFEGIYIDKRAYNESDYLTLENELVKILQSSPIYSKNNNLSFFNLEKYNSVYRSIYSKSELDELKQEIFNLSSFQLGKGFSTIEGEKDNQWIWLSNDSELIYYNYSQEPKKLNLIFKIFSGYENMSDLNIYINDEVYIYQVNSSGTNVNIDALLNSGKNIIRFKTNAQKVDAPADPRELYLRIINFDFFDNKIELK